MECFKSCAVALLVIVNFIFAAGGLVMLAFGIVGAIKPESVVEVLDYTPGVTQQAAAAGFDLDAVIRNSAIFLIILGAVVAVIGLFGCLGACCRIKWMLGLYITFLILVLFAEIALIVFSAFYPETFKNEAQPAMKKTLEKYDNDGSGNNSTGIYSMPNSEVALSWASLQFQLGCCGAYGYADYRSSNFTRTDFNRNAVVPVSCCKLKSGHGEIATSQNDFTDLQQCLRGSEDHINTLDCYSATEGLLKKYARIAMGIAAAIIGVEIILILLSIWICCSMRGDKSQSI